MGQRDSDLMQRLRITPAGALMLGEDGGEVTAGDDPKSGVAGHAGAEASGQCITARRRL
jgi:hypothetical protein